MPYSQNRHAAAGRPARFRATAARRAHQKRPPASIAAAGPAKGPERPPRAAPVPTADTGRHRRTRRRRRRHSARREVWGDVGGGSDCAGWRRRRGVCRAAVPGDPAAPPAGISIPPQPPPEGPTRSRVAPAGPAAPRVGPVRVRLSRTGRTVSARPKITTKYPLNGVQMENRARSRCAVCVRVFRGRHSRGVSGQFKEQKFLESGAEVP